MAQEHKRRGGSLSAPFPRPSAYAHIGWRSGLRWYPDAGRALAIVGTGNRRLGAALLAATSARCAVTDNVRRALAARTGAVAFPAHRSNVARALAGKPLSGPKVEAFRRALLGDTRAIVIDVWTLRAFGETRPTIQARNRISRSIKRAARRHNVTPRDYQAAIWCGIQIAFGREPVTYSLALYRLSAQACLWENPC